MHAIDALQISPRYTSRDWNCLDQHHEGDWSRAAEILRDRLEGRFLRFANDCLKKKYSGFVVLSIDCLLAEAIQQFKEGVIHGHGKSKALIKHFLEGHRFQPDFDESARKAFYDDIRCGLLHQAEAREMWLIRRNQPSLLQKTAHGSGYIIDVRRFHGAVTTSLDDYLSQIATPEALTLRSHLWKKMDHICQVREARGVLYDADAP